MTEPDPQPVPPGFHEQLRATKAVEPAEPLNLDQEQPVRKCAHCAKEIENRGDPRMDGSREARWVHVPGSYSVCFPQQSNSPRATPARHTVETITPEALDQLYEDLREARLDADRYYHNRLKVVGAAGMRALDAEQRAEKAEAAIERVRARHRLVNHRGRSICAECSAYDGQTADNPPLRWPCPTITALDEPKETQS